MTDQAPVAGGQEASISPEIADYFGVEAKSQAPEASKEKVSSDAKENKDGGEDKTKENVSESKDNSKEQADKAKSDEKSTEDKKTTDDKKEVGEDKKDAQPTEFEVAGTKYPTFDDAVKAVNRINGDNTRLSGDVKSLKGEKSELLSRVESLEKLLSDYKEANQSWQQYYDGDGEKPDETRVNLEEIIEKKLAERETNQKQKSLQDQYSVELDEIFKEEDFEKNRPFFEELINDYDGVPKVSPKKNFMNEPRFWQKKTYSMMV